MYLSPNVEIKAKAETSIVHKNRTKRFRTTNV